MSELIVTNNDVIEIFDQVALIKGRSPRLRRILGPITS